MMRVKKAIIVSIAMAGILLFINSANAQSVPEDEFVFGLSLPVETLDPHQIMDRESSPGYSQLYNTLVNFSPEESELQPSLATSWEVKNQAKEWIFHLREGVTFHDGTSFNAQAVVFSFQRQLNPDHPYYEEKSYYGRYLFGNIIDRVQPVDEYTVRFTLKTSYAPFIYALTTPAAMIVSPEAVRRYKNDFYWHPVGTGPFKLLTWGENDEIVLEKYDDYWGEEPPLNLIAFRPISGDSRRFQALTEEEVQAIQVEDPAAIPSLAFTTERVNVVEIPHLSIIYLALNMRKSPLNRLPVREAIYRAINKQEFQEILSPEETTIAESILPPHLWGYNPNVEQYEFDPEKSKKLLQETKVEIPTLSLWIPDKSSSTLPDPEPIAKQIQNELARVGINVQIVRKGWRAYLEGCERGEHHIALAGWRADFPDPDNILYPLLHSRVIDKPGNTNWSFYQGRFLEEILERARKVTDKVERRRLYQVAQKIVQQDIPCIPLFHTKGILAFSPKVEGVNVGPGGAINFGQIRISG